MKLQIDSTNAATAAIQGILSTLNEHNVAGGDHTASDTGMRQLISILKTLQLILQQQRTSASQDSSLVPCLRSLLTFGYSPTDAATAYNNKNNNNIGQRVPCSVSNRYIPPPARPPPSTTTNIDDGYTSSDTEYSSSSSTTTTPRIHTQSSSSGKIRFLALACLQTLIKSDPKAIHSSWPTLLPSQDDDIVTTTEQGHAVADTATTTPTLAHPLLVDPSVRVRHAAAATIATLVEGPAQRAYLAIAEAHASAREGAVTTTTTTTTQSSTASTSLRGFVPLSEVVGSLVVGTHQALWKALRCEEDVTVVMHSLRALCTVIVGTPYHRLPQYMLPQCMHEVYRVWRKYRTYSTNQVLIGSLSCIAAIVGIKPPPAQALVQYLSITQPSSAMGERREEEGARLCGDIWALAMEHDPDGDGDGGTDIDTDTNATANTSATIGGVQLEAIIALRGLVQQYFSCIVSLHEGRAVDKGMNLVSLAKHRMMRLSTTADTSPRHEEEKIAQQSILLLGDYVASLSSTGLVDVAIDQVFLPAIHATHPTLRAAGYTAISCVREIPNTPYRAMLVVTAAGALQQDTASPVRAAAAKAIATLIHVPPSLPGKQQEEEDAKFSWSLVGAAVAAAVDETKEVVAAVRVQGAMALVAFVDGLVERRAMHHHHHHNYGGGSEDDEEELLVELAVPACIRAATDSNDRIKPHGITAVGAVLAFLIGGAGTAAKKEKNNGIVGGGGVTDTAFEVIERCMCESENVKVQWSACDAAGRLLSVVTYREGGGGGSDDDDGDAVLEVRQRQYKLVELLDSLVNTSSNARTRSLAALARSKWVVVEGQH